MNVRSILFLGLLAGWFSVGAQAPFEIDDAVEERNFMPYELTYFVDPADRLTFIEISSVEFSNRFKAHTNYQNVDFKTNAAYWIRLPIRHTTTSQKIWLLEFYDQTIDHIEAYIPQNDGAYRIVNMGDQHPFSNRLFLHKNFEIQLDMQRDTVMVYYFKVRSHEFADIRIALRSVNRFVYYALNEYFLFGTFYGMILIITLYNFLVYLAIREIKNIFYICYILSVAGYAMSMDGIGFQYLWPNHPDWNNYAVGVFLYSLIAWALIFTRKFLSTKANAPQLDKALFWMLIVRTLVFVVELLFFPQFLTYRNPDIIPLSLIFYTAITVWRGGYKPARFFVIAYGILFTGFFLRMMVYFNVLPFTTVSHYSLHFAFVLEMLFLTFALGDRIRILKDMRDRALRRIIHQHELNMQLKDKVNRELEEKVHERTLELDQKNRELEDSNRTLVQQADKLNKINSMLDLDNWKLKGKIKEVLNERLQEKTMDYAQFKTLYPDNLSCYRFLENLKWENGFSCKKCGNEKFFNGAAKFARRCSRCGYNESITAFTIFQGLKFPIEKAFYIAYLTVNGKRGSTLEALAQKLDLGTNTVWAFKTKVKTRITDLEKKHKKPMLSRWEEVILEIPASHQLEPKTLQTIEKFS
ncbi:MAG: transposase [Cyclobacteriaceae bacterium]|nr:transposase [Cyclobacteriaceae bacterium]UYN86046.1 MAG: transposase [Cyclobacteriaceae bacterium]